ncbi:MAG: hypothetical protein KI790_10415 [Cyclobacteriaceae bacterium]|nr:hypothetical protein [Cyclobacteriaceae bacterium HetDA_MAG_MS6]
MTNQNLHIIGFIDDQAQQSSPLPDDFDTVRLLSYSNRQEVPFLLKGELELIRDHDKLVLVILDMSQVFLSQSLIKINTSYQPDGAEILFPGSDYFHFSNPILRYFYWKHYPRPDLRKNYLDANVFIGKVEVILDFIKDIGKQYPEEKTGILQDAISRYYVDSANGCFQPDFKIRLDKAGELLVSTRFSRFRKLRLPWLFDLLLALKEPLPSPDEKRLLNVKVEGDRFQHLHHGKNPVAISALVLNKSQQPKISKVMLLWKTLKAYWLVLRVNKWHISRQKIFRYSPNKSLALDKATQKIVHRLKNRLPLSFAHYNDGELTFIRDFLEKRDHEKWFGRRQQQYNPLLAERLHDAMKFRKEGYFVGVPCSTDHGKLRKLADVVVGDYEFKVPAMSIHHNLAYMPRILYALRDREVFFFTNEYQELTFFEHLGIQVKSEKVIKVPFRNSYLEYDKYQNMKFPENAVVVLTCGMLAKILVKAWYESHDDLTVLALGSSLDDQIQKENIDFELYPKDTPLTKNLHKSRSFLFGYKKRCRECYDF